MNQQQLQDATRFRNRPSVAGRLLRGYTQDLQAYIAQAWNAFWFAGDTPPATGWLRMGIGILALSWQLSFTPDFLRWFAESGWFDAGVYYRWVTEDIDGWTSRFSFLFGRSTPVLWLIHGASAVILGLFTFGVRPRITGILSWVVVLAYVHRAPFVCGPAESILVMVLGYLACTPQTIARRLIQVHLVTIYAVMLSTQLMAPVWWNGEALWWINAQQLADVPHWLVLRSQPIALNLWTFAFLVIEAAMVTVVWNRTLRPLVLLLAAATWLSYGALTGRFGLPLIMIVASLAFVDSNDYQTVES